MLTIGSLFTGIAGLDRGLELVGLGPVVWQAESDPYNFHPTLTAEEAGALIDALLELLPAARGHSKLADSRDRKARQRAPRST